jgi:hypothetical protein
MKRNFACFAWLLLLLPLGAPLRSATIRIEIDHVIDAVDPRIYGVINVVNRHKDQAIATDLQSIGGTFAGTATLSLITSEDVTNQPYTYEARDTYAPPSEQVPASGSTFHCVFPAHSFTQIGVGVDRR